MPFRFPARRGVYPRQLGGFAMAAGHVCVGGTQAEHAKK